MSRLHTRQGEVLARGKVSRATANLKEAEAN